jgi:hypothetical protein
MHTMTEPDTAQDTDVSADPDELDDHDTPLTTDADQKRDDMDPNEGEGGSG